MFVWNLLLALAWTALTGQFTPANFAVGFALGYLLLALFGQARGSQAYTRKALQVVRFALFYLREVIRCNLRVAYDVLTPGHEMRPGVLAIPLEARTDLEITLLANLISMTPGTLSLEVAEDRSQLYLHAMYTTDPEALRRDIKELEQRVLEVLR